MKVTKAQARDIAHAELAQHMNEVLEMRHSNPMDDDSEYEQIMRSRTGLGHSEFDRNMKYELANMVGDIAARRKARRDRGEYLPMSSLDRKLMDDGYEVNPMTDEDYDAEEMEYMEAPRCPACGGQLMALGQLGSLMHYRCRQCGGQFEKRQEGSSNRRKKNPSGQRYWIVEWFNEDHPVEPSWVELASFKASEEDADERFEALQAKYPDRQLRMAWDMLATRAEANWERRNNPGDVHIDIHSHNTRGGGNVRAKNPMSNTKVLALVRILEKAAIFWQRDDKVKAAEYIKDAQEFFPETGVARFAMNRREYAGNFESLDTKEFQAFLRFIHDIENHYRPNPTQQDVDGWVEHYRGAMQARVDGKPERAQYVVKITTTDGKHGWLRVGKGTRFDEDVAKARVYRNGDKANEAATKVSNWLKKNEPAKFKKIKTISAEPKK